MGVDYPEKITCIIAEKEASMAVGALGRKRPTDWDHFEKFPLSLSTVPSFSVPVVLGINWYTNFDAPGKDADGKYWIGRGNLGSIRGGHCVCVKDVHTDSEAWWDFYDQGSEGACVGYGCSRAMSLLNRERYAARWLWEQARLIDEWADNDDLSDTDQGTSVRAGFEILRTKGHRQIRFDEEMGTDLDNGIKEYRWTHDAEVVVEATKNEYYKKTGAVSILNSWGRSYPRRVWMPLEVLQKLLNDEGEAGILTDR